MGGSEQATIGGSASFSGIGVHFGKKSNVFLKPAKSNTGIIFRRIDLAGADDISDYTILACPAAVAGVQLGTRIENTRGVSVSTIEHLMAALAICGIDNVIVDVDGPELPIMDGSAAPFVEEIQAIGIRTLGVMLCPIEINETFEERDGDRYIRVEPADERLLNVTIDFEDAIIGRQSVFLNLDDTTAVMSRVAPARTFCRLRDVEAMRAAGFSQGGSLANAIVVDAGRMLNKQGLRDPEEFALHKALDIIGDLYLLGAPLNGRITAFKPSHELNTKMARCLASTVSDLDEISGARAISQPAQVTA